MASPRLGGIAAGLAPATSAAALAGASAPAAAPSAVAPGAPAGDVSVSAPANSASAASSAGPTSPASIAAAAPLGEEHRLGQLWVRVFVFLEAKDLHCVPVVCRLFQQLCRTHTQSLWRAVVGRQGWRQISDKVRNWNDYYLLKTQETAKKWRNGECTFTCLWGHTDSVCALHFDHRVLVTGSMDKTVRVWELYGEPRRCVAVLEGHESTVYQVRLHRNLVLSCSGDHTVRLWDISTLRPTMAPVDVGTPIYDLKTDGRHELVLACHDGSTRFLDLRVPGLEVARMTEHAKSVLCVEWDHDRYLVTGSQDKTARVLDRRMDGTLTVFRNHRKAVTCVSWNGTSSAPVTGSLDKTVRTWSWDTGRPLKKFEAHTESISAVQVFGQHMVTGSNDRTIRVWTPKNSRCIQTYGGFSGNVYALQFSDNLIVNGSVRTVNIMDFEHREGSAASSASKTE